MCILAMWFVTIKRNEISALQLQQVLGFGSYDTAWTGLQMLRQAMVRPELDLPSGASRLTKSMSMPRKWVARQGNPTIFSTPSSDFGILGWVTVLEDIREPLCL